jgi:hypothetical protein
MQVSRALWGYSLLYVVSTVKGECGVLSGVRDIAGARLGFCPGLLPYDEHMYKYSTPAIWTWKLGQVLQLV